MSGSPDQAPAWVLITPDQLQSEVSRDPSRGNSGALGLFECRKTPLQSVMADIHDEWHVSYRR
jgi:hypothetical protein